MNFEHFKCERCGACCRIKGLVRLTEEDVERIAAAINISVDAFLEHYTDLSPNRTGLILKDKADGRCILLSDDNLCLANTVKPRQCKTFPYAWTNDTSLSYCPALRRIQK